MVNFRLSVRSHVEKDEIVKLVFASLFLWCSQQFSFNSSAVIQNEIYFVSINSIIKFIKGIINALQRNKSRRVILFLETRHVKIIGLHPRVNYLKFVSEKTSL